MAMGAGVGGGAASFSRLWVQQLLVAEVVGVCTAIVVEIPPLVFLRKEAKFQFTIVVATFQ